ncbi:MBL fold metallo-hydrolase [Actinosynnema sp. NPDC020468]|uniref:MBL fold metallo-hydrolase n=1 Tax=Actinosynnema sp. NPDC020468 TaxID=3154488 RepID=UPI0033E38627
MRELAPGVHQVDRGFVNSYLVEDVLVDGRRDVRGVRAHVLTCAGHAGRTTLPRWAGVGEDLDVTGHLTEGDEVGGFTVLDVPGRSPGHLALWRSRDGVLICGDVFFGFPRPMPPPRLLTPDPGRNRESMRRLLALRPRLVLFGHGRPLRDVHRLEHLLDR